MGLEQVLKVFDVCDQNTPLKEVKVRSSTIPQIIVSVLRLI